MPVVHPMESNIYVAFVDGKLIGAVRLFTYDKTVLETDGITYYLVA